MNNEPLVEQDLISKRSNFKPTLLSVISLAGVVIIIGMLAWLIVFCFKISKDIRSVQQIIHERLDVLSIMGTSLSEKTDDQTLILQYTAAELSKALEDSIIAAEDSINNTINKTVNDNTVTTARNISRTNTMIQGIESVYADLLEEQKKRTVDSLLLEGEHRKLFDEGLELFEQGKFHQANDVFSLVSAADPSNNEVRFYVLYSLFLRNRADRSQYRSIKEGFALLFHNGYTRPEMKTVLEFISIEETGIVPMEGVGP